MSISNAVKELVITRLISHDHDLEKHRKLQALNSDWNSSGRMLTSDVKQHGRKKEFEEKENESLMLKQLSSFTNVSHIARGKSSNLRVIVRIGNAKI